MEPHALTDARWELVRPLLPPQKPATGRPAKDHRTVLDGILWQLATGLPWRNLPERFGSWQTVYSRFRRWQLAGVWDRVLGAIGTEDEAGWASGLAAVPKVDAPTTPTGP